MMLCKPRWMHKECCITKNGRPHRSKCAWEFNTGAAQVDIESKENTYSGYATLALTQRIMSAGHGGQILLSQSVYGLTRDRLPENSPTR